jgi:5-methylcytosine-specific restriction endonuclease McrA
MVEVLDKSPALSRLVTARLDGRLPRAIARAKKRKMNSARKRAIVAKLMAEQDGRCFYCHAVGLTLTFDHKLARSRGGPYTKENGVAACQPCNKARGDMDFDRYCAIAAERRVAPE